MDALELSTAWLPSKGENGGQTYVGNCSSTPLPEVTTGPIEKKKKNSLSVSSLDCYIAKSNNAYFME